MIFNFYSFLPFALALPSLVTVNAISPRLVSSSINLSSGVNQIGSDLQLNRRDVNVRFTFYNVGLGACGKINVDSDFVVALNSQEFGSGSPGPHCFQKIHISVSGKSTTAQIVDECSGCPLGGLDLSPSLFEFFAPLSEGIITGNWSFTS